MVSVLSVAEVAMVVVVVEVTLVKVMEQVLASVPGQVEVLGGISA